MTDGKEKDNPSLVARVSALEISMGDVEVDVSAVKTDIKWIKIMVGPTFLVSMASLIILIVINIA